MLYKAVIALAMVLLPQTEAFTLSAPSGAIAACRAPAASIESEYNPLPPFSEEAATALPQALLPFQRLPASRGEGRSD